MSSPEPQEDAAALEAREAGEVEARKARGPLAWMAQNAVASNVLMVLLIAGGLAMLFTGIKQEVFPEIELDLVLVNVPYPGASPEEVEQGVILALEEAVLGLDGVKEIRSTANEGMGVVAIELLLGTDSDRALADVKSAVDRITSFPQDIERPVVALATNRRQVISLVIHGEREEQQLRGIAEDVRRRLLDDPNITFVDIAGTRPLEIGIEVPQEALREHGLTLDGIAQTIRQASVDVPAGAIKTRSGEVLLRTTERRDRGSEFGEIVLRGMPDGSLLRVRDVARIEDGFREVDQASLFNGEPAVLVNAYRVGDETPITIAESVFEHLRRIEPTLPDGVGIAVWNDASEIYADRISLLERNALIGLVLVILVLGLFLEPRLAFWVTLGIPISFAGSLLFLPMADVSINMISLFAFIVTLGMVVDDAIVVGEAIHHHRASGKGYLAAAIDGVREVARPVVFAILTSCVAFAPLLFVPGMMGKFFRVIPIVVIAVLLISLLESLFVLPAHLSHPMPRWLQIFTWPILKPISWLQPKTVGRWLEIFVLKVYKPSLSLALRWRYVTLAVGAATFLITVGLVVGGRV
ncbi:MAG: efflux RND transporter permease subunit, partial [Myxococcales bacterium]|nr:efflux RND transporter permease subunit [Myxococcales bacterium]